MEKHLTENKLRVIVASMFPDEELIFNKRYTFSVTWFKPDIYIPNLKLIIEFDGYLHYTDFKTQVRDSLKDKLFNESGIRVIRIPYFVQLNHKTIDMFFNGTPYQHINELAGEYPNGFISELACLPVNFNMIGLTRFRKELASYPEWLKKEITNSMMNRGFDIDTMEILNA